MELLLVTYVSKKQETQQRYMQTQKGGPQIGGNTREQDWGGNISFGATPTIVDEIKGQE